MCLCDESGTISKFPFILSLINHTECIKVDHLVIDMVKQPLQLLLRRRLVALRRCGHQKLLKVKKTVVVGIEYLSG